MSHFGRIRKRKDAQPRREIPFQGTFLTFSNSDHAVVRNVALYDIRDGIHLESSHDAQIHNMLLRNVETGVDVSDDSSLSHFTDIDHEPPDPA